MKIKLFIAALLSVVAVIALLFHEFLWELLLLALVLIKEVTLKFLLVCKKFFFKQGVVSFSTIAWKRVLMASGVALAKRAVLNAINDFFHRHIVQPLIKPLTAYLKLRWALFKTYGLWKKLYTMIFSILPASLVLWLIGILETLFMLLQSFSLAKFLTMLLQLISMTLLFFQSLWRTWIQPYIDLILVTIVLGYVEKLPIVGKLVRFIRVNLRWHWRKIKFRKQRVIDRHIDRNVRKVGEKIEKHVEKKQQMVAAMAARELSGNSTLDAKPESEKVR